MSGAKKGSHHQDSNSDGMCQQEKAARARSRTQAAMIGDKHWKATKPSSNYQGNDSDGGCQQEKGHLEEGLTNQVA